MKLRKKLTNEQGSATIEFLAMVPLVLLIMMIFWQFLVAGYAVIISQSALNEAAKTYAITSGDLGEASSAASEFINEAGGNLDFVRVEESYRNGNNFGLTLHVNLNLIFIPDKYVGKLPKVSFQKSVSGRVMD
ncbi:TadE-like protein [Cytobacillus oceanisediminis]|uniref:TadE-like protein n=1 Tax=Cytobacillus oceanisediminis TaxID=665099 RepID=A0A2V2ZCB2_9BACI|nr:TadE family protein [Cytobacillus oceanisediminis]PWW17619.1 TadE-like protein [Cytobacillus oceanisediminis]